MGFDDLLGRWWNSLPTWAGVLVYITVGALIIIAIAFSVSLIRAAG